MNGVALVSFVFLCGLVFAGLVGSVLEIRGKRPLTFAEPYVSRRHPGRSLVTAAAVGPLMLANEVLFAFREKRAGALSLLAGIALSGMWAFLSGIVVADIALTLRLLFS